MDALSKVTVLELALQLPRDLIASLDEPESSAVDEAWLDEAERRQFDVDAGAVTLEDWADVRARMRAT